MRERVHQVEVGQTSVTLSTKAISLQGAGGRMTATKWGNRLLTITVTGEATVAEIEMVATTENALNVTRKGTCPKIAPPQRTKAAEHVSSATKKAIWLVNVQIQTQDHPKNQWSVTSATKKAICPVNARTNKATTEVSNVNAEMTEVLTGEMRAG